MEILGELIHAFYDDPLGPPVELVEIYKDDSNEEEVFAGDCDWDIIAAYNVCLATSAITDVSSPVFVSHLVRTDGQKSEVSSSDSRIELAIGYSVPSLLISTSWPRS